MQRVRDNRQFSAEILQLPIILICGAVDVDMRKATCRWQGTMVYGLKAKFEHADDRGDYRMLQSNRPSQ